MQSTFVAGIQVPYLYYDSLRALHNIIYSFLTGH
jgi:hypothetical protein